VADDQASEIKQHWAYTTYDRMLWHASRLRTGA